MWMLVQVNKGNKYFEPESKVGNRVLISDSSELVISCRAMGADGYRFEARKGNETFVVQEFPSAKSVGELNDKFTALAKAMGAVTLSAD